MINLGFGLMEIIFGFSAVTLGLAACYSLLSI